MPRCGARNAQIGCGRGDRGERTGVVQEQALVALDPAGAPGQPEAGEVLGRRHPRLPGRGASVIPAAASSSAIRARSATLRIFVPDIGHSVTKRT